MGGWVEVAPVNAIDDAALQQLGAGERAAITLALRLRTPLEGASFGYCEGVVVTYANRAPTKIEVVRV